MKRNKTNSYNDFRWVILLLAGAVILPTICLLWFMSESVKNVQFAARELLIDEYSNRVDEQIKTVDKIWDERAKVLQGIYDVNAIEYFHLLVFDKSIADGVIIYNQAGNIEYPIVQTDFVEPDLPEEFKEAWDLEFVKKDYENARNAYFSIMVSLNDDYLKRKAQIGLARCLLKEGKIKKASGQYSIVAKTRSNSSLESIPLITQAAIMFAQLNKENSALKQFALFDLIELANSYISIGTKTKYQQFGDIEGIPPSLPMDSGTRILVQEKTIQFINEFEGDFSFISKNRFAPIQILHDAEVISAKVLQYYPNNTAINIWPDWKLQKLNTPDKYYGAYTKSDKKYFFLLWSESSIKQNLVNFEKTFTGSDITCRITDNEGTYVTGIEKSDSDAFLKIPMGKYLQDWHIELFFANNKVFENAAKKQIAIYIWAGALVIVLVFTTGGFAGRSIGRQMKMNKLKNDFIATVTHELKTPLASMRVLADTLLEGNYNDQKQVKEYLELICHENKRLTGLIDNFLTFSRMERNKQVFTFEKVSPTDIAKSAIEAIQTKYSQRNCLFSQKIDDDLSPISVDKDAIVTVLVNLLDNACKYTYDNKEIELRIFYENENVCFSVKDNGIGMTKRQMRKIFDRFYQTDTTLSRRAEGTGLGLSIVKFILDAHNATIEVKSQPEKGSTFIVKIPIKV